jgi:hypothetical protein
MRFVYRYVIQLKARLRSALAQNALNLILSVLKRADSLAGVHPDSESALSASGALLNPPETTVSRV